MLEEATGSSSSSLSHQIQHHHNNLHDNSQQSAAAASSSRQQYILSNSSPYSLTASTSSSYSSHGVSQRSPLLNPIDNYMPMDVVASSSSSALETSYITTSTTQQYRQDHPSASAMPNVGIVYNFVATSAAVTQPLTGANFMSPAEQEQLLLTSGFTSTAVPSPYDTTTSKSAHHQSASHQISFQRQQTDPQGFAVPAVMISND